MTPIFRAFSITAADTPDDWTATTSAIGATPVSIVSTVAFCKRPLSKTRKSEASRSFTKPPLASVTLTGTITRGERTSNRGCCCAIKRVDSPSKSAHLMPAALHESGHYRYVPPSGLDLPGQHSANAAIFSVGVHRFQSLLESAAHHRIGSVPFRRQYQHRGFVAVRSDRFRGL